MIYIYSDGSSTGRSNREWGWGFLVVKDGLIIAEGSGGGPNGTNNIAELEGAIQGFCYLINNKIEGPVTLISDSQYVLGIATGKYSPTKNLESCQILRRMFSFFKAEAKWVRGHSGNEYNERCDQLAKAGKELYTPAKVLKKRAKRKANG